MDLGRLAQHARLAVASMRLAYRLRASHLASLLLLGSSCSVLYDLSPDQCELNSECASFGSSYVCQAGLCKSTEQGSGGSGAGGSGNRGGTSTSGGRSTTGGGGSSGSDGGVGGNGGSGGAPPPECTETAECDAIYGVDDPHSCVAGECVPIPPECSTHAECLKKNDDSEPFACVRGRCVPLTTDECPVVLPRLKGSDDIYSLLKSSNAVIMGAFSFIDPAALDGITVRNYDLVLRDFFTEANGVVLDGQRRNVVLVVCSSNGVDASQLLSAGRHLAYDLDVNAILSALPADDTQRLFETFRSERGKSVFFLMPNYTDETLINLEDDNLIWHMLSGAESLGAAYTPLLTRTETHLRNAGTLGASEDMRVALITATDERFLDDLGRSIRSNIRYNGNKSATENGEANFTSQGTTSYTTDISHTYDHAPMVSRVLDLAPHVVIGATGEEMADKIIPLVESKWAAEVGTQPKPFYLVSPILYNSSFLSRFDATPTVRSRLAGVNWAAAEDRTVYNDYMDRYQLTFGVRDEGYENWYDAAYYLVYALAGGRTQQATAISAGFQRLQAGMVYNVGQVDMAAALTQLGKAQGGVRLVGANGPPNWNPSTGGRNDAGSVWCLNASGILKSDVLRYQPPPPSGGEATLTGTFPCFQFPKSPP